MFCFNSGPKQAGTKTRSVAILEAWTSARALIYYEFLFLFSFAFVPGPTPPPAAESKVWTQEDNVAFEGFGILFSEILVDSMVDAYDGQTDDDDGYFFAFDVEIADVITWIKQA